MQQVNSNHEISSDRLEKASEMRHTSKNIPYGTKMAPEAMLVINELSSQHNEAEQTKPRFSLTAEIA